MVSTVESAAMKRVTGTVTQGGMETFRLSLDEKRQLLESIAQADRGELIDGETLLAELDESN
jgi:hypothetical protein